MSDEPPPPPPELPPAKPDTLTEHEQAGVMSILIKTVAYDDEIKAKTDQVTVLNAELAATRLNRAKGVNALSIFGFDPAHKKIWTAVREVIGDIEYNTAIAIAKGNAPQRVMAKEDNAATSIVDAKTAEDKSDSSESITPKIGDAILAFLKDRGPSGAKVADVKGHLAKAYGIETHEKTPGMTLYRLFKDGKVHRDGRTWFYNAPSLLNSFEGNSDHEVNNENEASVAGATNASETALEAQ